MSAWGGAALAAIHTLVGVPGGSLRVLSHVHFASCVQMIYGNGEGAMCDATEIEPEGALRTGPRWDREPAVG